MEKGTQREIEGHWSRKKKIAVSIYKHWKIEKMDITLWEPTIWIPTWKASGQHYYYVTLITYKVELSELHTHTKIEDIGSDQK
jgi:hypothetical protein